MNQIEHDRCAYPPSLPGYADNANDGLKDDDKYIWERRQILLTESI